MVPRQTALQALPKLSVMTLVLAMLLTACGLAQPSQQQVQSLVQTSVASTMQAQNQVSTFVAQTVEAQQPVGTATEQPVATDTPTLEVTETPLLTLTPVVSLPTSTSEPSYAAGSGGYVEPLDYSCDQIDWRPLDGSVYYPGEHFLVKWTLLNNGTQQWCEGNSCSGGPDLSFNSGTNMIVNSSYTQPYSGPIQVPSLKPGKTYVVPTLSAIAPSKPGNYVMYWQLEDMQNDTCAYISIIVK